MPLLRELGDSPLKGLLKALNISMVAYISLYSKRSNINTLE